MLYSYGILSWVTHVPIILLCQLSHELTKTTSLSHSKNKNKKLLMCLCHLIVFLSLSLSHTHSQPPQTSSAPITTHHLWLFLSLSLFLCPLICSIDRCLSTHTWHIFSSLLLPPSCTSHNSQTLKSFKLYASSAFPGLYLTPPMW